MKGQQRGTLVRLLGFLALLLLWPGTILAQEQKGNTAMLGKEPTQEAKSPTGVVATNGDYRVESGDLIEISVWKEPEASSVVVIRPDGKISLPLLNDLYVSGKTPMEIQEMIADGLSPFINSPNVTVTVKEIRSKKVYVLGEVNRTGSYQILQPTTVLQILTEAGGLRPFAKEKSIYVMRQTNGKQERFPFNYKDVVKGKKIEQNILLQPGDTVVVP